VSDVVIREGWSLSHFNSGWTESLQFRVHWATPLPDELRHFSFGSSDRVYDLPTIKITNVSLTSARQQLQAWYADHLSTHVVSTLHLSSAVPANGPVCENTWKRDSHFCCTCNAICASKYCMHTLRLYCVSTLVGIHLQWTLAVFPTSANNIHPSSNNFMMRHNACVAFPFNTKRNYQFPNTSAFGNR
jgi:hypothetical protein